VARGSKRETRAAFMGPWLGMEERETFQKEGHCQIALNVDFHRGYIEGRKGFSFVNATGFERMKLHTVKVNGKPEFILGVGINKRTGETAEKQDVYYVVYSANGEKVYATGALTGEPPDANFTCQFADTIIPADMDGDDLKETSRHVTLIYTRHNLWVFDPGSADFAPRLADMVGDSVSFNNVNWGYWSKAPQGNGPFGPIMAEHQGSIWYAGFSKEYSAELTLPVHKNQNQIPEAYIEQNQREQLALGPDFVAGSDPFDPLGIVAYQFFGVEELEAITGLKSFQEQMVVFTDRSIYVLTGSDPETYALFKAVSGVGCIAPSSIVEANGSLFFMARDGIYAFGGIGAETRVQKISKPIDSMFSGNLVQTHLPESVAADLANLGWPFLIKKSSMVDSNAVHVQTKNQIWWSVDIAGTEDGAFALTLVFDYYHGAWSIYEPLGVARSIGSATYSHDKLTCMYDATVVLSNGEEHLFTSTNHEKDVGDGELKQHALMKYGSDRDDDNVESCPIPFIYLTGRLFRDNLSVSLFRPIRIKMLSWGSLGSGTDGPEWFVEGEEAHADSQKITGGNQVSSADQTQATSGLIPLHPVDGSSVAFEYFYMPASASAGTGSATYSGTGSSHTPQTKYQERDWFTSKLEPASVRSRSIRIGFRSGYTSDSADIRKPELVIQGYMVDVEAGDTR